MNYINMIVIIKEVKCFAWARCLFDTLGFLMKVLGFEYVYAFSQLGDHGRRNIELDVANFW